MNEALAKMDERFSAMYEADFKGGRPSIAPEKRMRAMLLQVLSVRSERQLVEQINYNLLLRWFVGLSIDDSVGNHSVNSQEPRPHDRARRGHRVVQGHGRGGQGQGSLIRRTLQRRRHADKGLGRPCVARTAVTTGAIPKTGVASGAATRPTNRRPTPIRSSTARRATPPLRFSRALAAAPSMAEPLDVGYEISQRKSKRIEQCFG
jgi:Transposase domain (DUF772)